MRGRQARNRIIPGYNQFVSDKWKAIQVDGWGGFVLKEKFKLIKGALKEWHEAHARNLPATIASLKKSVVTLECKGEVEDLSEAKCAEILGVSENIHTLSRLNTSLCWKQSRNQWLREGDANSKFFHSAMSSRRRRNAIRYVLVDGVLIEGVESVQNAIFTHFPQHFRAQNMERPSVSNLHFCSLSLAGGGGLIKPFSLDEVKAAVWDCDCFKSPGPDGVNFGFIKDSGRY